MAQELDQAQRRRHVVLMDDFSPPRKWESTVDIIGQGTCAPINPRGWNDPLSTPQEVLKHAVRTDTDSGRLYLALREGYEAWRDALKKAATDYDRRLYDDAIRMFGTEGPKAYKDRSPELVHHTGPAPQAWEPVEAALQGNSVALGRKPLAADPRIAKYFAVRAAPVLDFADASLGDLPDDGQDDMQDGLQDLEETADPEARGGKTEKVGAPKKVSRPPKALVGA